MSAGRRFGISALCCALLALSACAGRGIPSDELPRDPIAVLYWEREEARRRDELIGRQSADAEYIEEGIATPSSMAAVFGRRTEQRTLAAQLRQWPGRLALVDPRSAEVTILESTPPGARPLSWDPEHQRLLFTSNRITGSSQLFEYDRRSDSVRPLTHGDEWHAFGDFGADGRLAYAEIARNGRELVGRVYVANGDGSGRRRVVDDAFHPEVRLHPSGESLLLVRAEGESRRGSQTSQRFVMIERSLSEGGGDKMVGRGHQPVFSRDGKWLVYVAQTRGGPRIVRGRADGAGRRPLSQDLRDHVSPAISPDGAFVASAGTEGVFSFLFIRRIDGSGERILLDSGSVAWPVW